MGANVAWRSAVVARTVGCNEDAGTGAASQAKSRTLGDATCRGATRAEALEAVLTIAACSPSVRGPTVP